MVDQQAVAKYTAGIAAVQQAISAIQAVVDWANTYGEPAPVSAAAELQNLQQNLATLQQNLAIAQSAGSSSGSGSSSSGGAGSSSSGGAGSSSSSGSGGS